MNKINSRSPQQRKTLRMIGLIMVPLGICLMVFGVSETEREFDDFGKNSGYMTWEESLQRNPGVNPFENPPQPKVVEEVYYDWLAPIGGFMTVLGLFCLGLGYMGAMAKYQLGEMAPLAKDGLTYMTKEGKEGITALGEAFFAGQKGAQKSPTERLEELNKLHQRGLISDEEYQENRKRILEDI